MSSENVKDDHERELRVRARLTVHKKMCNILDDLVLAEFGSREAFIKSRCREDRLRYLVSIAPKAVMMVKESYESEAAELYKYERVEIEDLIMSISIELEQNNIIPA